MEHEMTAKEFVTQRRRMCNAYWVVNDWDDLANMHESCGKCPLNDFCDGVIDNIDEEIAVVAKWAAEHPEGQFKEIGDGIYFDPQHKIVADEVVRVTTIEMTNVVPFDFLNAICNREFAKDELADFEDGFREYLMQFYRPDNLSVRVQQFITKCHEEEV